MTARIPSRTIAASVRSGRINGSATMKSCETAATHEACRTVSLRTFRPTTKSKARSASPSTKAGQRGKTPKMMSAASTTAIQSASRVRFLRSQRPLLLEPCSTTSDTFNRTKPER